MEKLNPSIKKLMIVYCIIIFILIIAAEVIIQRHLETRLFRLAPIFMDLMVIIFLLLLVISIRYAGTNSLFKKKEKQGRKLKNYLHLSFAYSILVIITMLSIDTKNTVKIASFIAPLILVFALNAWVIYRVKAGEIEKL